VILIEKKIKPKKLLERTAPRAASRNETKTLIDEQARTLKTKGLKASEVEGYALRDVNIKSGKDRTKSSMK
jgi:hypothetical protein